MTAKSKSGAKTTGKTKEKSSPQLGWGDWSPQAPSKPLVTALPPKPTQTENRTETATATATVTEREPVAATAPVSVAASAPAPVTAPVQEPVVLTVGALNKLIRGKLETTFGLVWLKGEISNFKSHPSGHFYFSLKDKDAQISAVMFRGYNAQLRFKPEDGMEVVVRGKITVYEPRGNYQIMCEQMEPVGAGALQKAFEQLKRKLQGEGLFDEARKRPIPQVPKHIAIVTSPTGAAIRDMLNVLNRRYKAARITVVPCVVQGDRAPREIIQAIQLANRMNDVDVLIVGRGGGSIEDLWGFNDEGVARAIAGSRVPVISAVGHEVDFTIADFVADLRAPTPSAAAELVAKSANELLVIVQKLSRALSMAVGMQLRRLSDRVRTAQRLLIDPRRRIMDASMRCDDLVARLERTILDALEQTKATLSLADERLETRMIRRLDQNRQRLARGAALLDSLSPLKVLDRGYAMASVEGRTLSRAKDVKPGDVIEVRLAEGRLDAKVISLLD